MMAVFTKALTQKWTPNAGRPLSGSRESANPITGQSGEIRWDSGISQEYSMTYLGRIRQPFPLLCSSMENPVDVQIVDVVEEAQLKGAIPMDGNSTLSLPRGMLSNNLNSSSSPSEPNLPRSCLLTLSIHGLRISDPPQFHAKNQDVLQRLPLHSLLSAVSFQGHQGIYVAVAVTPESSTGTQALSSVGGGVSGDNNLHDASRMGAANPTSFLPSSSPSSSSSSCDVVFASCFVFQATSSPEATTFVRDLKDVFVAAMRSNQRPNANSAIYP